MRMFDVFAAGAIIFLVFVTFWAAFFFKPKAQLAKGEERK